MALPAARRIHDPIFRMAGVLRAMEHGHIHDIEKLRVFAVLQSHGFGRNGAFEGRVNRAHPKSGRPLAVTQE